MATQVQFRRGSTAQVAAATPAAGEIVVDTDKDTVVVGDGSTAGGFELARADGSNWAITNAISTTANISFGDNDKAIFGAGSDLKIYHDGSNSYIEDVGTGNLRIMAQDFRVVNSANSESMIQADNDGAVRLYYDNSNKLATTSTGIDVTGTVTADGLTVATSTDPASITLRQTGNTSGFILKNFDDDEAQLVNVDNGPMVFKTNDTERLRITSAGGRVSVVQHHPAAIFLAHRFGQFFVEV